MTCQHCNEEVQRAKGKHPPFTCHDCKLKRMRATTKAYKKKYPNYQRKKPTSTNSYLAKYGAKKASDLFY